MKSIVKFLAPIALAFGTIGAANAQSLVIETDYPGPAPQTAVASAPAQTELYVLQSNEGPAEPNPAFERSTRSRAEVQSEASIAVPFGPAMNA